MLSLDYYWQTIQDSILKLSFPYNILLSLIIFVLILLYILNKESIKKYIKQYNKKLNILLQVTFFALIVFAIGFYIFENFYPTKPPEDQLVVAISSFYYIDEYGQIGSDINTANDLKEKLEAKEELAIKIIMLETSIRSLEEAKIQGKKVGAHLVVYGETKSKIGKVGEIKYNILPLQSLETILVSPSFEVKAVDTSNLIISEKARFSMVTDEPIMIVESLTENASSAIYAIGAYEKYKKSNFSSAIALFKSVKNYEKEPSILFYIANSYSSTNNLNESLRYFDKAIEINPFNDALWNNKGVALSELGRYKEAIIAFDNAILINHLDKRTWNNKGLAIGMLGRYEEAIIAFDKVIEIDPRDVQALNNKGVALANSGKNKEAIAVYDKVIEINPRDIFAWYNKGVSLYFLGENEKATLQGIASLLDFLGVEYSTDNVSLEYIGHYEEALKAFDKVLELNPKLEKPKLAQLWFIKGATFANLGKHEEAIAAYDKALEINPQLAEAWYSKGVSLYYLGKNEEAKVAVEKAYELDPTIKIQLSVPTNSTNTS